LGATILIHTWDMMGIDEMPNYWPSLPQ